MNSPLTWLILLIGAGIILYFIARFLPRKLNNPMRHIAPIERLQAELIQREPYFDYTIRQDRIIVSKDGSIHAFIILDDRAVHTTRKLDDVMIFSLKQRYRTKELSESVAKLQQFKK